MNIARFLGMTAAVVFHAGILLFGGLFFAGLQKDHAKLQQVELLSEDDTVEKAKEEAIPEEKVEPIPTETEPPPDAEEVIRNLEAPEPNTAPALEAASLSQIEAALNGQGVGGGDFAQALDFASGGRIGGTGKAGALDEAMDGAFNLADIDQKPRAIYQASPLFPSDLRGKKIEGLVTVLFVVDVNGKATAPRVDKSSHPSFDKPALDAVKQWKFEPAIRAGQRVPVQDARDGPFPTELMNMNNSLGERVWIQLGSRTPSAPASPRWSTIVACALCAVFASSGGARAQDDASAIWKDPTFQKQFIGDYGINADIEPRVTPEELKTLEKIRPMMADDLPQAESTLKKVIKPESSAILDFTLGRIQYQQDKMPEALGNYQRAVDKFPSFRRAWRSLGLIYARDSRNDDAIHAFIKMIELGGGDGYSYGLLAFAYAAKQDYQAAEAAFRNALLLQPENVEWRYGLTRCAFKQQKFEDASTLLNGLIERYPDKAEFWILQANTFLGMKQPLKAAQNFEALDFLGKATVDTLHTLGDIYVSENLMDLAAHAYQRAIDVDAKQPVARPLRSVDMLAARNALPQARLVAAHIRAAWGASLEGEERTKLLKLEARLSMADGSSTAETAAVLEEIVKLDPLDGEALMLLGQHYARQNEPDRAMFYYERAANIEAFEVKAKMRHAQLLVGLSRYAEAVPLIRRAQELKPRDDIARYLELVERNAKAARR